MVAMNITFGFLSLENIFNVSEEAAAPESLFK